MSGKPASVGASRAGVPGGPARVLVYVADPRQLEPGAVAPDPPPAAPPPSHLDALYLPDNLHQVSVPRNTIYRTQVECSEQRNQSNTVFYKPASDVDGKVSVFSAPDTIPHRPDFLQIPQQFLKDPNLKVDDVKVNEHTGNLNVKADCVNSVNADLSAVESYQSRIALEGGDLATYQRCAGPLGPDSAMPSMHQVALQHGHNQFSESVTVQSGGDGSNSGDRELSRSYVNYQVLEQSVSHQSIVNQSISILNQQVGVSRGIVSEGDSGHAPQLVRTADGVVLAVLPSSALTQSVDNADLNSRTVSSDSPQTIVVPLGWRRIINGSSVLYVSPSGTALSTLPQLRDYLQTAGTCKCGLPCPLRPETAFNFDPKVVSKPYQASSGPELTKLCNHKRKLLATLQARSHSPATPPPQHHIEQKKVTAAEVAVLKKKMKKRPNFPPNMTVSQLMVQRERPLNDFKPQENEHNRTVSPGIGPQRPNNGQSCLPTFAPVQQNVLNAIPQDNDAKQDTHVQRSSHYLTVSSGWITQQEHLEGQKPGHPSTPSVNSPHNVGLPVLGTNGQVIGVNTGFNKQTNYKNVMSVMTQNMLEHDIKDEKKDIPVQQNIQPMKNSVKDEESQIFCGLNQPLTPEVMQKINEQQQIFIQQNQKQIEMAMKGFKTQLAENVNHCKPQNQNQYVPQGQLVIQNGAVVKTNPAKTPPWQVKRNDTTNSNAMTSPNLKSQKTEHFDYEESNTSISDDSLNSYSSYPNNEHAMNQAMCSRVPPLPQHYNMLGQQWPNTMEINKKKSKTNNNKGTKKKNSPPESKLVSFGSNGMRLMPDNKTEMPNNNVPSFMDDPSGYLAQQTVLLNNTISRQGINSSYDANQYENPNCYSVQNQVERSCKPNKSFDVANTYRSNLVPNPSPSPNNTPDSSVLSDKSMDSQVSQCCKGCNISVKGCGPDFAENQMRLKFMKQCSYKMETDRNLPMSSPKHGFDDNPVTSSTFIDRSPLINDNCGPIQAGTVSTSNVSPTETLQPPEPSPTLSNSSRSTDTPHSTGSSSSTQMQSNCSYPIPSPAYSNPGSCKEHFNSNPSTPGSGHVYSYNSPGPPYNQSISGTQMMHFISNHNVNKNLMEVDNISMVGVKPGLKPPQDSFRIEARRRMENSMPGYCPPPHLGGGPAHSLIQACYVQTFVTTMASGFSVTRDTVTSVLAGKANTVTTSINASQANFIRPPPPPSVNLATTYAIPNNQPDPFINSVNLPTSYPLHIAGTTAQNMISKSPLEMVQTVIGSIPSKPETSNTQTTSLPQVTRRPGHTTPGQILISSTGQIIVSNNQMPPPPPKTTTAMSPIQGSSAMTNVSTTVTQVVPAVGGPMVNQPTVVVNTLPAPFVIQPPMMAVDGQVVQQNTVLPHIGIVSGQSPNENPRQIDMKNGQSFVQGVAMLSPESLKKRNKKKKTPTANITNVLQITAPQQNPNNLMVHHSSPQHNTSPQFSPRSFQLSPNNNISPTPMLQALTIVPGKSGTPAHIVMNGQGNTNNFGSQQIITNTSPSQQINLLQPVNLINNASGVMSNFPAFQQFIVPNLGGMVMTADGTAIIQDNSTGMPMQLQLQTVNGQNVLTPVQNPGVFAGANGGVVIRAQNQQGKMIQSQHSPGAQFLSPNSQVMMSSPNFNGQLSPLLANLSPPNVQFNAGPQVRAGNVQAQEFIQTNQMGQMMVPLSPKQASIASAASRTNSTFVQQNTTIVQQQTTVVSNSAGAPRSRLSIDPAALLAGPKAATAATGAAGRGEAEAFVRHSVSTQTLAARKSPAGAGGCSPPDTTTHSPLGAPEPGASPRRRPRPDTTTDEPEPADASSSAMVQCVSSSEPDVAEAREHAWPAPRNDFNNDNDTPNNMMSNVPLIRQNRGHNSVESTDLHYNQNINTPGVNNQHNVMPMTSNYYERTFSNKQTYKRKNDFGDGPTFRTDKIMRTNYGMVHGLPKESDYDNMGITSPDKAQARQFPPTGSSSDASAIQKVFDRHNLGSGDGGRREPEEGGGRAQFSRGDVVWGPARGHAMWPGALRARAACGRWLVRWFGSAPPAPALLPARRLLALSDGLEAHHAARTNHRKSRKLNTLLETAIQEAMAELDKKSENATDMQTESTEEDINAIETLSKTPKKSKKHDKVRKKDKHHKKNAAKLAPNLSKTGDNSRLRSSR